MAEGTPHGTLWLHFLNLDDPEFLGRVIGPICDQEELHRATGFVRFREITDSCGQAWPRSVASWESFVFFPESISFISFEIPRRPLFDWYLRRRR
jgi:hypothetical protein